MNNSSIQKKPIPVKYFYYGMLLCVLFIGSVFFFLWWRESNQTNALDERGVKVNAWVVSLYESKRSKRASPNYYMEVGFFTDSTKELNSTEINDTSGSKTESDKLLESLAKQTESLRKPIGDYETQTITLPGYQVYSKYKINDKVKIEYLPEDHTVLRLVHK
jgi:hypothetical protein